MLNMTLGSGIMWASLFLTLGTVAVVWINNVYRSRGPATNSSNGSKTNDRNSYVCKGEHDESIRSLHQRLNDMHKENKGWWKGVDEKVDSIRNELRESMTEQRKTNDSLGQRITQVETVQKVCKKNILNEDPKELLHKKAISLISQSGMTSDLEERMRLLEEASKVLEHIKEETRNGGKYGNPE